MDTPSIHQTPTIHADNVSPSAASTVHRATSLADLGCAFTPCTIAPTEPALPPARGAGKAGRVSWRVIGPAGVLLLLVVALVFVILVPAAPAAAASRTRLDMRSEVDPNFRVDEFRIDRARFFHENVLLVDGTLREHLFAELCLEAEHVDDFEADLRMALFDVRDDFLGAGRKPIRVRDGEYKWIRLDLGPRTDAAPYYFRLIVAEYAGEDTISTESSRNELERRVQQLEDER